MKFNDILTKLNKLDENQEINFGKQIYQKIDGVIQRKLPETSSRQKQTENIFSYKWNKINTYNSKKSLSRIRTWLLERYGDPHIILNNFLDKPTILDVGTGAGVSALEYWDTFFSKIRYVALDISNAITIAKERFKKKSIKDVIFIQESVEALPFKTPLFDIIFAEGVLHHTDSTKNSFYLLCNHLKSGGYFMFYIYCKKAPIREFCDDYIRKKLAEKNPSEVWDALIPLTELGIKLGELDVEIEITNDIPILEIAAGKINLQRFFYWYIFKAFYNKNLSFKEMHHINFDWYAPKNSHRHSIEEVHKWCQENNLTIRHEKIELSGITCIAQKN
ncbi:MAG: class I SAM-dependent methyltransferase [Rickettsiella sp.]|nr:class I SAM-dependent methyltransferase [Rickettsiella sp.]